MGEGDPTYGATRAPAPATVASASCRPSALAFLVAGAFLVAVLLVLGLLAFVNDGASYGADPSSTSANFPLPSVVSVALGALVAFALGCACVCARHARRRAPLSERDVRAVMLALTALVFAAQLVLVRSLYAVPGWDAGTILEYARWKASGLPADAFYGSDVNEWVVGYLDIYPNNALLTFVLAGCYRLGALLGTDGLYVACLLGALCVSVGGLLTCLLVARLTGSHAVAFVSFALYALLFSLSPWISVPYSDTYAALFVALVLWLGGRLFATTGPGAPLERGASIFARHGALWIAVGAAALLGYLIKPTVLIVCMVLALVSLVRVARLAAPARFRLGLAGAGAIGLVLAAGLVLGVVAPSVRAAMGAGDEAGAALGMSHFLMMGQNGETTGSFLQSDVDFSRSVADPAERSSMERAAAVERVASRSLAENVAFYANKLLYSFGDGTFLWAGEAGDGFFQTILPQWGSLGSALRSLFYRDAWQAGADRGSFQTLAQIAWCAVLVLAALGGLSEARAAWGHRGGVSRRGAAHPLALVAMLAVLGLMLYLLVFECRARYLYCFGPAVTLCASVGLAALERRVGALAMPASSRAPK